MIKFSHQTRLAMMSISVLGASSAFGESFPTLPQMLDKTWESHISIEPTFVGPGNSATSGFNLNSGDRRDAIIQVLSQQGVHPLLNLRAKQSTLSQPDPSAFGLSGGGSSGLTVHEYSLTVGNTEVCKSSIKSVESSQGFMHVVGVAPNVDAVYPVASDAWPTLEDAVSNAKLSLAAINSAAPSAVVIHSSQCLYPLNSQLEPAWRIVLKIGTSNYEFYVADQGTIEGNNFGFDATIRAYDTNSVTGSVKDVSMTLDSSGTMTNQYFTTKDFAGGSRESSSSGQFLASPGATGFAEQSVFVHTNQQYQYAVANGYSWKGPSPLVIQWNVTFSGGNVNNAQFVPSADGSSSENILVANGDGVILQNLAYDASVVKHEFGHHVIYGSVTTISGESLILHEGLADTFTFLALNDPCLGESICPAGSTLCQVQGKCLRSGQTTMSYNDATYTSLNGLAHQQGQVISGFFWDLKKNNSIPAADLNKLAFTMISYLPSNANVKSMITGILNADYSAFNQQYRPAILAAASGRGMGVDTLGISLTSINGQVPASSSSDSSSSGGSSKGFLGLCSIGSQSQTATSTIAIIMALLMPIIWSIIKPKRVPVKSRSK